MNKRPMYDAGFVYFVDTEERKVISMYSQSIHSMAFQIVNFLFVEKTLVRNVSDDENYTLILTITESNVNIVENWEERNTDLNINVCKSEFSQEAIKFYADVLSDLQDLVPQIRLWDGFDTNKEYIDKIRRIIAM